MSTEIEKKFRNFDLVEIQRRLAGIGITPKQFLFRIASFQVLPGLKTIRVRHEGDKTTLTVKEEGKNSEYDTEWEVIVSDFTTTKQILEKLGMKCNYMLEKFRTVYPVAKYDAEVVFDEFPALPPYMEIEAKTEPQLLELMRLLGLANEPKFAATGLYDEIYGITPNREKGDLTFERAEEEMGKYITKNGELFRSRLEEQMVKYRSLLVGGQQSNVSNAPVATAAAMNVSLRAINIPKKQQVANSSFQFIKAQSHQPQQENNATAKKITNAATTGAITGAITGATTGLVKDIKKGSLNKIGKNVMKGSLLGAVTGAIIGTSTSSTIELLKEKKKSERVSDSKPEVEVTTSINVSTKSEKIAEPEETVSTIPVIVTTTTKEKKESDVSESVPTTTKETKESEEEDIHAVEGVGLGTSWEKKITGGKMKIMNKKKKMKKRKLQLVKK
jgi:adenylate cyclase class IV